MVRLVNGVSNVFVFVVVLIVELDVEAKAHVSWHSCEWRKGLC